jgi:hypothetical protein
MDDLVSMVVPAHRNAMGVDYKHVREVDDNESNWNTYRIDSLTYNQPTAKQTAPHANVICPPSNLRKCFFARRFVPGLEFPVTCQSSCSLLRN